ncbi:unnamed protein product [Strongylus vulgaris]|uniref:Uncharacterized protein n=1 Tax=Strongylus vulgaris TaxID=40348 RepID=A0A3P7J0Y3_STRVU|nr:unnamed protein product [Strongylus vulgaris]
MYQEPIDAKLAMMSEQIEKAAKIENAVLEESPDRGSEEGTVSPERASAWPKVRRFAHLTLYASAPSFIAQSSI